MKLLLTGAWNPAIPQTPAALEERRRRLVESIRFYVDSHCFDSIVLLDATIDHAAAEHLISLAPDQLSVPRLKTAPTGSFAGPSYLESLLYVSARSLFDEQRPDEHLFKISGGYVVRNIDEVVSRYATLRLSSLGYLHQNPLRLTPRYAMTSCMAMGATYWQQFVASLPSLHDELRSTPLESIYRQFLVSIGATRGPRMPYPRLQARFATGGGTSDALPYRLREAAWRLESQAGLFVLATRRPPHAP